MLVFSLSYLCSVTLCIYKVTLLLCGKYKNNLENHQSCSKKVTVI